MLRAVTIWIPKRSGTAVCSKCSKPGWGIIAHLVLQRVFMAAGKCLWDSLKINHNAFVNGNGRACRAVQCSAVCSLLWFGSLYFWTTTEAEE